MPSEITETRLHLLLIEDSPDDATLVQHALNQTELTLSMRKIDSAEEMTAALAEKDWDLVISDYNLPGFSGTEALQLLRKHSPDTPFIVVSGCIGEEAAVALMKAGADDYVMKDNLARLQPAVDRSLKDARIRTQSKLAEQALRDSEARFKAIASNIPGTVFQLLWQADGISSFSYVSDGCQALLGVPPQLLYRNPHIFFELINAEDSSSFSESMRNSALKLIDWNWEGRMHVHGSDETKWINLRSSPRQLADDRVLWEGILSNITQNKLADLEVRRSREDLFRLSSHVEKIKEQERARIAREIHDDLGSTLSAIKIDLIRLGKKPDSDGNVTQQRLHSTMALVDSAIDVTRRIATELRPGILDLGIVAAIEWQSEEFQKRMDIPCQVTCAHEEIPLDDQTSIALFRIFQETLTNVAKHANASLVEVKLDASNDYVNLIVRDNGRGLTEDDMTKQGSFGIRSMRQRALNLGGEASFYGISGSTVVRVRVPYTERTTALSPVDNDAELFFGHPIDTFFPSAECSTKKAG